MIQLGPVEREHLPFFLAWRNDPRVRPGLRTPYLLTMEHQEEWYREVVRSRAAPSRYWSLLLDGVLCGYVGLHPIAWENGTAEIALLTNPEMGGRGIGTAAVRLVLTEAFDRLRLVAVHGEVYACNPAVAFWRKMFEYFHGDTWVCLPQRKYWDGQHWDGCYFNFTAENFRTALRSAKGRVDAAESVGVGRTGEAQ